LIGLLLETTCTTRQSDVAELNWTDQWANRNALQ